MKHKITLSSIIVLFILAFAIQAIPQNGITINSPASTAWTNEINYTAGFNFSFTDNEYDYSATCSLYMGTDYNLPVIMATGTNSYQTSVVNKSTETVFYMNHTFPTNNTKYYWTIRCINNSHLPASAPDLRTLKQDVTTPLINVTGTSFTNNTYIKTLPLKFEVLTVDSATQGESLTVSIRNGSGHNWGSASVTNGTRTNLSWSPSDGTYIVHLNSTDPAGNTIANTAIYTAYVDTVAPSVTWNSPAVGLATAANNVTLNWSLTEQNLDTIILNWSGSTTTIDNGNCSGSAPSYSCTFTTVGSAATRNIPYSLIINDSATNEVTTPMRYVSLNISSPTLTTYNWTISDSTANWRTLITATTPSTCSANVYNNSGDKVGTVSGTIGTVGATTNCTGTLSASDILTDGAVRLEINVTDEAGTESLSNHTGVMNYLYAGWNLITYADTTRTVMTICDEIESCTSVAWFNNSGQAYMTYSTSTPATNNGTSIAPGDAILVYVSADSSYIANDYLPGATDSGRSVILYDGGWNTMGLTENANLSSVYNAVTNGTASDKNITYASWYNADTSKFSTCKRSSNTCAGTTTLATNIDLPLGYAVWVLTDLNANYTINRSEVTG